VSGALVALHRSRRRAEASNLLRTVTLASISDGVITTNTRGHVTFLNTEAERLTGWQNQEAAGEPLNKVLHIADRDKRSEASGAASRGRER
jgi:PAS domain S-box-containing protein